MVRRKLCYTFKLGIDSDHNGSVVLETILWLRYTFRVTQEDGLSSMESLNM